MHSRILSRKQRQQLSCSVRTLQLIKILLLRQSAYGYAARLATAHTRTSLSLAYQITCNTGSTSCTGTTKKC